MPLKCIKCQKGKNILVYNDYLYSKHEVYENKIVWRCSDNKKFACKRRCHTISEDESGNLNQKLRYKTAAICLKFLLNIIFFNVGKKVEIFLKIFRYFTTYFLIFSLNYLFIHFIHRRHSKTH